MADSPSSRALRYPLRLTVRYREKGGAEWRMGTTQNISESGVLFLTDGATSEKATLEMMIQMLAVGSHPAAEIACQGTIVRRVTARDSSAAPAIAVEFSDYRFVRGNAGAKNGSEKTALRSVGRSSIPRKGRGDTQ